MNSTPLRILMVIFLLTLTRYLTISNLTFFNILKLSGTKVVYDIHETNVIRSHPKLPIFVTGGKGIVNIWSFSNLRIVNTLTSSPASQKEIITSLKFNNFGDKLGAIDQSGAMNLWKFNLR